MGQRGKKSTAEIVTLNVGSMPPRLLPPSDLSVDERRLFVEVVSAVDPRHFVKSDLSLLISYVQSTLLSRHAYKTAKLAKNPNMLLVWEKATRMQATLATRLRLAPQARADPKTVGRQHAAMKPMSHYETMRHEHDED